MSFEKPPMPKSERGGIIGKKDDLATKLKETDSFYQEEIREELVKLGLKEIPADLKVDTSVQHTPLAGTFNGHRLELTNDAVTGKTGGTIDGMKLNEDEAKKLFLRYFRLADLHNQGKNWGKYRDLDEDRERVKDLLKKDFGIEEEEP